MAHRTARGSSPHTDGRNTIGPLPHQPTKSMIAVTLALVPLLFATGCLTWTMTMGAREQARSDAWAKAWARKHHGTH